MTAAGVTERLTGLVGALRAHGLRIGTGETVDAALAMEALGFADRELLREGLAAADRGQRPNARAVPRTRPPARPAVG